jgi:predicted transcriptional regulator
MSSNQCYASDMDKQGRETRITIRIPAEIAEMVRRLAKQHDRSLNGEIVRALREYAERHKNEK